MRLLITLSLLAAGPAWTSDCPPPKDHSEVINMLHDAVRNAPDERTARTLSKGLWEYWLDAPNSTAQVFLDEGMVKHESGDTPKAIELLSALIDYCPDYAEGYNQRAFVYFNMQDYDNALKDLETTIDLMPGHTGALTGKALTFWKLDRNAEASIALRQALTFNPWLSERHLLPLLEKNATEL